MVKSKNKWTLSPPVGAVSNRTAFTQPGRCGFLTAPVWSVSLILRSTIVHWFIMRRDNQYGYGSGDYRYEVVEGWGQIPQLGLASAVACDSQDRVYVFNRSPNPAMLVFERDGRFIGSWGEDLFKAPHGIWISPDDEIYTTDTEDHTVRRFSLSGELLQTWGTVDEPGPPGQPFNQPTRAVLSQSGEMYVSDGYGQSRVHRMTLDGEAIVSWGAPGSGPSEFNLPHDVTVGQK